MILVDGLECSQFDRDIFLELSRGKMGCVTVTLGFWEDALESIDALTRFRDLVRDNQDLVEICVDDSGIRRVASSGRCALLLGYQNTACLSGRIRMVEVFADLGVRVMQLTYNNQNDVGGSCYEVHDQGLARFGREVVEEMNRQGILVDLSHVGERTSLDAVALSAVPVAITHANPSSLVPHLRNKSDELLRALAARGGVVGLATYPNITGPYVESADRWSEMVARTVDLCGVDHVGIGTDLGRKNTQVHLDWMRMGRWSRVVNFGAGSAARPGKVPEPAWLESTETFPAIPEALDRRGFSATEVAKIVGENWMRLYGEVFSGRRAKSLAA
jgi:microsomal dipeptidase-like Zn-dependent dipeptidase